MSGEQSRLILPLYNSQTFFLFGGSYANPIFQFLKGDQRRLGFYISFSKGANIVNIGLDPDPLNHPCMELTQQVCPFYISREQIGDVITEAWYAYTTITNTEFACFEIVRVDGG